jgi:hypothetical protein
VIKPVVDLNDPEFLRCVPGDESSHDGIEQFDGVRIVRLTRCDLCRHVSIMQQTSAYEGLTLSGDCAH